VGVSGSVMAPGATDSAVRLMDTLAEWTSVHSRVSILRMIEQVLQEKQKQEQVTGCLGSSRF